MMTKFLLAFVPLALAATIAVSPVAEAESARKVQFGFPLGSFTARPSAGGGGGGSGYTVRRTTKPKTTVTRRAPQPERPSYRAKNRIETASPAKVESETTTVKAPVKDTKTAAKETGKDTASENTSPVTQSGSTALVTTDIAKAAEKAAEKEEAKTSEISAQDKASSNVVEVAHEEKAAAETETSLQAASEPTAGSDDTTKECKKFIPAIGLTISVGCEK